MPRIVLVDDEGNELKVEAEDLQKVCGYNVWRAAKDCVGVPKGEQPSEVRVEGPVLKALCGRLGCNIVETASRVAVA